MPADRINLNNIEDFLIKMQKLQVGVVEEKPEEIVQKYAEKAKTYRSVATPGIDDLTAMEIELRRWLKDLVEESGDMGKLMATKAMDRFLEKSERRDVLQRELRAINNLADRQVQERFKLYRMQLKKEVRITRNEIEEFFQNARASGRTKKETLAELVKIGKNDGGILKGFKKRARRVAEDAARREAQERATAEYRKMAKPGEFWEWIAISAQPCPDCVARAGRKLKYLQWVKIGLPGHGRTVCRQSCKCQLVPVTISDELFPDTKSFRWDRDKQVLTTASEARTLKSAKK